MTIFSPTVVVVCLAFVAITSIIRIISTARRSPLKHIPVPWYATFTHHVLKYHTVTGRRMFYIDALHRRHGPVVRIAPDEVSVADPDGYVSIHRMGSGFNKSRFYMDFIGRGEPGIFTMTDPKQHAARRKLFARAFTVSSLRENCETLVREKVELAIDRIRSEAVRSSADVHEWWSLMATDVIGQLSFGESFEMLENGKKNNYVQALDAVVSATTLRYELPLLHSFVSRFPTKSMRHLTTTRGEIAAYSRKAVDNMRQSKGDNKSNLFATIMAESEAGEKTELTDNVIRGEAANMLFAGSDTLSSSLTYLVWAVLKRPGLQRRLEEEFAGLDDGFDDEALEKLPLLNAVINESLRLYGAVPGTTPRVTPPAGATIGGYHIPGGTIVTTQVYTMHRLPEVFPDPLKFDETRFLPGAPTEKQKQIFSPFGTGSRSCIGVALARMEMRLAVALLFRRCPGIKLADTMTDEMMEMASFIVMKPAGNRCDVTLGND
ncbi:cytochrome p450 monooxygenase [Colletotrichum plurivorum]|uniref:Cytochrome p450 monooxygenase n=1 Tax=Colletotrichum plurivorum TaxID=2175906 RepID=A0A8H6JEZ2_9PEZI|nr:cytochrome p450 monooxygenase [Colletotrichum plurivorum]